MSQKNPRQQTFQEFSLEWRVHIDVVKRSSVLTLFSELNSLVLNCLTESALLEPEVLLDWCSTFRIAIVFRCIVRPGRSVTQRMLLHSTIMACEFLMDMLCWVPTLKTDEAESLLYIFESVRKSVLFWGLEWKLWCSLLPCVVLETGWFWIRLGVFWIFRSVTGVALAVSSAGLLVSKNLENCAQVSTLVPLATAFVDSIFCDKTKTRMCLSVGAAGLIQRVLVKVYEVSVLFQISVLLRHVIDDLVSRGIWTLAECNK